MAKTNSNDAPTQVLPKPQGTQPISISREWYARLSEIAARLQLVERRKVSLREVAERAFATHYDDPANAAPAAVSDPAEVFALLQRHALADTHSELRGKGSVALYPGVSLDWSDASWWLTQTKVAPTNLEELLSAYRKGV